jgi:oligopeptide transport system ATP-binding protein
MVEAAARPETSRHIPGPLVEAREVSKVFAQKAGVLHAINRRFVRAVDRVSLTVNRGEIVGLVGESGCGKSTLGRLMIRLETPTQGAVLFNQADITKLKGRKLRYQRRKMQIIFQDPASSLNPRFTVRETLVEAIRAHRRRMSKDDLSDRLFALIAMVGLTGPALDKYPKELSSGHRQHIAIARALAVEPQFIVADEPVSALDSSSRAQIVDLIDYLRNELEVSFLLISHDLDVIQYLSGRVAVMYLGRVVEIADAKTLFEAPRHPYTRALVAANLSPDPSSAKRPLILPGDPPSPLEPPTGCYFHPRCAHAEVQCKLLHPEPREPSPGHFVSCHFDL